MRFNSRRFKCASSTVTSTTMASPLPVPLPPPKNIRRYDPMPVKFPMTDEESRYLQYLADKTKALLLSDEVTMYLSVNVALVTRLLANPFHRAQIAMQLKMPLVKTKRLPYDSYYTSAQALSYIAAVEGVRGLWRGSYISIAQALAVFGMRKVLPWYLKSLDNWTFTKLRYFVTHPNLFAVRLHFLIDFLLWPFEVSYVISASRLGENKPRKRRRSMFSMESIIGPVADYFSYIDILLPLRLYNGYIARAIGFIIDIVARPLMNDILGKRILLHIKENYPKLLWAFHYFVRSLITTPLIYPFNTISRRQIYLTHHELVNYKKKAKGVKGILNPPPMPSIFQVAKEIYDEEGILGFYNGVSSYVVSKLLYNMVGILTEYARMLVYAYVTWTPEKKFYD